MRLDYFWFEPTHTVFRVPVDRAEFFIVLSYRRRGVGSQVVAMVRDRLPGKWEAHVLPHA